MTRALLLVSIAAFANVATSGDVDDLAESVESLSPYVRSVTWNANRSVRIIILEGGFEHVSTPIFVQWLSPPTRDEDPRILRTLRLSQLDMYSWSDPLVGYAEGVTTAIFSGNHTYTTERAEAWVKIGAPGDIQVDRKDAL